jgi:hypothetical protein
MMTATRVMAGRIVNMTGNVPLATSAPEPTGDYAWSVTITHEGRPVAHLGAPDAELVGRLMRQLGAAYHRPLWRRWWSPKRTAPPA